MSPGRHSSPARKGKVCLLAEGLAGAADHKGPPAILIKDGRIQALGEEALAAGAPLRRLEGFWLAPAPIDAHVHLWLGGRAEDNLRAWHQAGVAAVRDMGHSPARPTPRPLPGQPPLLRAAGVGLGAKGEAASWLAEGLAGAAAFAAAARARARAGAGLLKVFATGLLDFESPGRVEHPLAVGPEELAAVVAVAREVGLTVAVHASGVETVRAAVEAGVTSIEHGFFLDQATLKLMAARGVAWVPTLAAVQAHAEDPEGRHTPHVRDNLREIARSQARAMRRAEALGVELVMGSDAGSYGLAHGQALRREMAAWWEAGLSPRTVFAACTQRAARLLGLEGEVGVMAVGARAWLWAWEGDPRREGTGLRGGPLEWAFGRDGGA